MLNKLLPSQVSAFWDSIKHGIEQSCPADITLTPAGMNRYLMGLLSGGLQCWMATERKEDGTEFYGNVITKVATDDITEAKSLVIVSLYLYKSAPDEIWKEAYESLVQFGRANDCKKVLAYTTNPAVLNRGTNFGFNTMWQVVAKDI